LREEYDRTMRALFGPRLERALEETNAEIDAQAANVAPVELDQQSVGRLSRMDAMQAQAMAQAYERRLKAQKVRIEHALTRLAAGEYGYCTECGEEIGMRRLDIDPAAHRCVRCA